MAMTDQELYAQFLADVGQGQNFANQYLPSGSLGRLTPGITEEEGKYLESIRGLAGPSMDASRLYSQNVPKSVDMLGQLTGGYQNKMGDVAQQGLLNTASAAGKDPNVKQSLAYAQDLARTGGELPDYLKFGLNQTKAGLGGLNSKENLALYEQGLASANKDYNSAMRNMQGRVGGSLARGGAFNDLQQSMAQNYATTLHDMSQKRQLANVDVVNQRQNQFNELATAASGLQSAGKQAGVNIYGSLSNSANANTANQATNAYGAAGKLANDATYQSYNSKLEGNKAYNQAALDQQESDRKNAINWANIYGGTLKQLGQNVMNKDIFNLGQQKDELASYVGALLGIPEFLTSARGQNAATDITTQQLNRFR